MADFIAAIKADLQKVRTLMPVLLEYLDTWKLNEEKCNVVHFRLQSLHGVLTKKLHSIPKIKRE